MRLPAGTVTFLLTDIEGSARLWEEDAEAMSAAVGRSCALLGDAIAHRGGVRPVEQGEGDSVVAAFTRASDALTAALDAQAALHAEACAEPRAAVDGLTEVVAPVAQLHLGGMCNAIRTSNGMAVGLIELTGSAGSSRRASPS